MNFHYLFGSLGGYGYGYDYGYGGDGHGDYYVVVHNTVGGTYIDRHPALSVGGVLSYYYGDGDYDCVAAVQYDYGYDYDCEYVVVVE